MWKGFDSVWYLSTGKRWMQILIDTFEALACHLTYCLGMFGYIVSEFLRDCCSCSDRWCETLRDIWIGWFWALWVYEFPCPTGQKQPNPTNSHWSKFWSSDRFRDEWGTQPILRWKSLFKLYHLIVRIMLHSGRWEITCSFKEYYVSKEKPTYMLRKYNGFTNILSCLNKMLHILPVRWIQFQVF